MTLGNMRELGSDVLQEAATRRSLVLGESCKCRPAWAGRLS
jgi:hypothetical protein